MTERQWQQQVIDLARLLQWSYYHTFDSRRSNPGFPDLVLWKDRTIFAELKTNHGRLTAEQRRVAEALARAGAEVYVWRPRDLDDVQRVLTAT